MSVRSAEGLGSVAEAPVRIMIVDDEERNMTALCETLRDHGYETLGFTAGEPALAALRESAIDLLLTDLMMPGMDGIALLRAAHEIDRHLIGIVMTGQGSITTAVEAMKAGAFDYILKPCKLAAILPALERARDVRRLHVENARLERRVRERTTELEATNKELEAFTYSVSHDLRAPLRHIDGFTQFLIEDHLETLPAEAQQLARNIRERVQHMGRLIEDLLQLSRLGRQPLTKRRVPLAALVQEALYELRNERTGRAIEIRVGALPEGECDVRLLRQVFVNLLSNALKFTRNQTPARIEIECALQPGELKIVVRDNGAGFDMRSATRLFGVFQRLHRAEDFEGTGVGLSIVQRIIARHGGRVWAEAEVDRGAAFYFTLPTGADKSSP